MMSEINRVAVVGAGATGAYLAAQLSNAGVSVTLIARGSSLEQIRTHGIEVLDPVGNRYVARPARVLGMDEIDETVDLVLFCVKTYDTAAATVLIAPLLAGGGHVLCLQNGVKNEQILADAVGASRVLSGVLYIGSERTAPGAITCSSLPRLVVGPYKGGDQNASLGVRMLFAKAKIECVVEANVSASKWQKFLFNCGLNPLTAITGQRLGQLLSEPATADVFHTLVDEAAEVAIATGAPLRSDHKAKVGATAQRMDISSSMAEDLQAGRPIELDAFTGYVIMLGKRAGVPTPATKVVHGILTALDVSRRVSEVV